MPKILFSNPCWWDITDKEVRAGVRAGSRWPFTQLVRSRPDQFVAGDYTPYPFFMGYAASYAAKHTDFEVRFRDSIALKESYASFIDYVNAEKPDYLVLEMWTSCRDHDTELIRGIHKFWPNLKIIITGPICITKSKEILETLPVVATVKGEYEKGVVRVLKGETGDIGFDLLTGEEMNAAPFPYMDHIHAYRYFDSCPRGVQFPHVHVWSSRGCVFKCLAGDTIVHTEHGPRQIEDLVAGRRTIKVLTRDINSGRDYFADATAHRIGTNDEFIRVFMSVDRYIRCTPDHKFFVDRTGCMGGERHEVVEAKDLKPKDRLVSITDESVMTVERYPGTHKSYCLNVPETGWFYANGVLVKNCEFCITPGSMTNDDPDGQKTRKMRFYTKDYMEAYLKDLVARFDYKSVYFDDDTFNMGNKHTLAMCEVMDKIKLPWAAMCRVDTVNRDTWLAMKKAGCYGVKLGFESGSQYVVDKIVRKGLNLEEARDTVYYLRSIGMQVHGTFTYGHPGETPEQRKMTLKYRNSLPLTSYQESGVAEMDGSPLAEMRKGALRGYEGATMDEGYVRNSDGVKKIESMIKELQNQ